MQALVDEMTDSLHLYREVIIQAGIVHCGIVWPGFIATLEALGEKRQAEFAALSAEICRD